MTPTIAPADFARFSAVSRKIITLARLLEWDVRLSNNKRSVILRSEDQHKIVVPATNVNANRSKAWLRQIIRHTPDSKIINLYEAEGVNLVGDPEAAEITALLGMDLRSLAQEILDMHADTAAHESEVSAESEEAMTPRVSETVVMEGPVDVKYQGPGSDSYGSDWWVRITTDGKQVYVCKAHEEEYVAAKGLQSIGPHNRHHMPGAREHVVDALQQAQVALREKRQQERAAETTATVALSRDETDVVARRPWLARLSNSGRGKTEGSGTMYESPYVDVVTLWDGNETYECRQCKAFRSENPRGVANHSAKLHGVIQTERTPIVTPHYEPSGFHRQQSPVTRLSHEIVHALDTIEGWREMDALELATTVATVMVEARPDRQPMEPLTDQQILARIAGLLDRGQLAEVHQQMEQLSERLRESEALAETAARRAARAESNLSALRDLLNETREE